MVGRPQRVGMKFVVVSDMMTGYIGDKKPARSILNSPFLAWPPSVYFPLAKTTLKTIVKLLKMAQWRAASGTTPHTPPPHRCISTFARFAVSQ